MPKASAIISSPFGHGRDNALAKVDEFNPALRDSAAKDVPFFRRLAMISAGCQSVCFVLKFPPCNNVISRSDIFPFRSYSMKLSK